MHFWIVTGGIASGKSALCAEVQRHLKSRVHVFSSDAAVAGLYAAADFIQWIAIEFGRAFILSDSSVDRPQLRELVFRDENARHKLESFLHPQVYSAMQNERSVAEKNGAHLFLAEVPLLLETKRGLEPDLIVLVAANPSTQARRIAETRGLNRETATRIIQAQMPLEKKISLADVVVWNEGETRLLALQTQHLLLQIESNTMFENLDGSHNGELATMPTTEPVEIESSPPAPAPDAALAPSQQPASNGAPPVEHNAPTRHEAPAASGPQPPFPAEASINELQCRTLGALHTLALELGWRLNGSRTKHQIIAELVAWMAQHGTKMTVEGFLEIPEANFGLIRYPKYNFTPLPEDIFVPVFVLKKFNLRAGQRISATIKAPREREKFMAMDRLLEIEGKPADDWQPPADFEKLTATFPSERIILETPKDSSVSARVVDLVAPLGKGQRALIVASPRSGKTMLLKEMARSIKKNHKEVHLIILLLDERPEEVTDFEESVATEIYSSTFDEASKRHAQVAELVLERAKRLVEMGEDVVLLLDSITRLARGYNAMQSGKGAIMSGGLGTKALMKPKKFFGSARKVEEGGSLTIVATALVETESRMDCCCRCPDRVRWRR